MMKETHLSFHMHKTAGMQSAMTYIDRRKVAMAQWVVLQPLFEVCARGKFYKGFGSRR